MSVASTPVPLSEAKARLSELARRVRLQHERITLTRNGEAEAVLLSVDDLDGLEMTLEILGDNDAVARISESLAALGRGEPGADLATVRQDLARRRATGPACRQPLFGPLAGCHGARRGTYRIVYRIDEASRIVHVLDVDHRSDIYHQPKA